MSEKEPTGLFWLSFADDSLAKGSQFLGGCAVRATHMVEALRVATALGLNPGGEVKGFPVVYPENVRPVPDGYIERLLTREECDEMEREMTGHA